MDTSWYCVDSGCITEPRITPTGLRAIWATGRGRRDLARSAVHAERALLLSKRTDGFVNSCPPSVLPAYWQSVWFCSPPNRRLRERFSVSRF